MFWSKIGAYIKQYNYFNCNFFHFRLRKLFNSEAYLLTLSTFDSPNLNFDCTLQVFACKRVYSTLSTVQFQIDLVISRFVYITLAEFWTHLQLPFHFSFLWISLTLTLSLFLFVTFLFCFLCLNAIKPLPTNREERERERRRRRAE